MGFLNLLAFGYLASIGLVVFLYIFNKKKNIVHVSSLIPWGVLNEDTVRSKVFKIDLLFLLQILLILLLVFFLAKPYIKSSIINISGKNIVLVVDSSASMQTVEGNETRFDQARSQALKMIGKLGQWDKMMVISSNYSSTVVCDFTNDKAKLNKTINDLMPKDTGTNLDEGVSLGVSFLKNAERGEMYVLTDRSASSINFTNLKSGNIKFITFGKESANVAITSLDVYQDMFKDYSEREAYVTIENYSNDSKTVRLSVFLNDEIIMEEKLELASNEQKTLSVMHLNSPGILKAGIQTDDFLSVDNTAYAIINEIKPINILLVSDNYSLKDELAKIEQSTHRIIVTHIATSEYEQEVVKDYDVAIFHKFIPDNNPNINALYITPYLHSPNSQDEDVKGSTFGGVLISEHHLVSPVKILDWDNSHPTMLHLTNLDGLDIKSAFVMKPPDWSIPLIKISDNLNDSPIAFAGWYKGKKIMSLGFDLSDFDFSKSDGLRMLIMTLNIIQWLNPYEAVDNNKLLTGGQYRLNYALTENIEIVTPGNEVLKYDAKEDATEENFVFNKIEYTGEYKISGTNLNTRFVANLFDVNESRIAPGSIDGEELKFEEKEAETLVKNGKTEIGKYLLLLVPFILFIEWLLYHKKVRAGTA
ncbi:MAG: VWA domain-containing protein [Candidatus Scalindua sp.]|nr:VWA domain-containing protein [Candidatus Scalindua sp.]MCR4344410.1 VWA domain-containing protein [Candidatus Scalindua sp.]